MKKKFWIGLIAAVLVAAGTFLWKTFGGSEEPEQEQPASFENSLVKLLPDGAVLEDVGLDAVEHFISTDRESIYLLYSEDECKWFETTVELRDKFNDDCDGKILSVTNVFQVQQEWEKGFDCKVIVYTHNMDGETICELHSGFWAEDNPLNNEPMNLTFQQAFDRAMQSNLPKPDSRYVVLRKEVGPNDCAPQYIFGNRLCQIYVDAVSGDADSDNPVFKGWSFISPGGDMILNKPLGEWP